MNLLHILLVLVALQSTIAVADLHQAHQASGEHQIFDQANSDIEINTSEQKPDQTETKISYDCHHCCHCHGVACYYLDNRIQNIFADIDTITQFSHLSKLYSHIISPNLRPPIV